MKQIKFIRETSISINQPVPAKNNIPEWYKNTLPYINGKNNFTLTSNNDITGNSTIKKCMPVFDAITSGYLLVTPADIYISQKDNKPFYQWSKYGEISFHPKNQVEFHPFVKQGYDYIAKFVNVWAIETPVGYSTLFLPPMHRENNLIILPGIVDTDKYKSPVELPFVLKDIKFEGMIEAGTPIAQIIPIKREHWKASYSHRDSKERDTAIYNVKKYFINAYKKNFWVKKEYN